MLERLHQKLKLFIGYVEFFLLLPSKSLIRSAVKPIFLMSLKMEVVFR